MTFPTLCSGIQPLYIFPVASVGVVDRVDTALLRQASVVEERLQIVLSPGLAATVGYAAQPWCTRGAQQIGVYCVLVPKSVYIVKSGLYPLDGLISVCVRLPVLQH